MPEFAAPQQPTHKPHDRHRVTQVQPPSVALSVYADRPSVCRGYSCANDERIWSDFEKMQLNTAWIDENLHATGPRLAHATMVQLPDPVLRPGAGC